MGIGLPLLQCYLTVYLLLCSMAPLPLGPCRRLAKQTATRGAGEQGSSPDGNFTRNSTAPHATLAVLMPWRLGPAGRGPNDCARLCCC